MEVLEGGQLLVMKRTRRLPRVAEVQWRKRSLEVRKNAGAVQGVFGGSSLWILKCTHDQKGWKGSW